MNKSVDKETKPKPHLVKRILNVLFYIVIGLILLATIFYACLTLSSQNGVTRVFGYVLGSIQTNSMSGDRGFEPGDMIISKSVSSPDDLNIDDVISFFYQEPSSHQIIVVSHRIIDIDSSRGYTEFIVKGDAVTDPDDYQIVPYSDVIAKWTGNKIPGLGKVSSFLQTSTGFLCCILIPLILFLFYQGYQFVMAVIEAKNYKHSSDVTAEARRLAEEMVKKMQSESGTISENSENSETVGSVSNNENKE